MKNRERTRKRNPNPKRKNDENMKICKKKNVEQEPEREIKAWTL
jgi:hypothetical protein